MLKIQEYVLGRHLRWMGERHCLVTNASSNQLCQSFILCSEVVTRTLSVSEWRECIACSESVWSSQSCKRTRAGWCQGRLEKQGLQFHLLHCSSLDFIFGSFFLPFVIKYTFSRGKMHKFGTDGKGHSASPSSFGKWLSKWCMCILVPFFTVCTVS